MAQAENPLVRELREVINRNGRENGSNTPDFLLAAYLLECLEAGEGLIQHRDEWYGIHPAPGWRSADERDSLAAERERAAWTRDIATMLRAQTGAPPHLRPGILYAANFLDPDDTAHLLASPANATHIDKSIASLGREDPAHRALMVRLEEQKSAIIAARELLDPLLEDGLKNWAGIEQWLTLYGALADPPLTVEVEEDDGDDDDVPHDSPQAGRSSGRWQPLSLSGEPGGMAHLDFAEDAARRSREADDG